MRSRRRWLALAVGCAVVLGWEVLFRVFPPPDPRVPAGTPAAETITLEGDAWLLWQLRPGDRVEHGQPVHVNALGFRDRDRGPRNGHRIMTLGDSSVYGFGVGDDEVFSSLMQKEISVDVVDGATPGWSTFQTLNMLDMRGWSLDPDLLVIGNLWSDNNFDDFVDRELLASYAGFAQSPAYRARVLLSHSALFRWLDWQIRVGPAQAHARTVGWTMGGEGPKSGKRRVAINDYADNLDTLCARAKEHGAGVIFLLLANREDVHPLSPDPAWGPYRKVMQDAAARHGVPIVDFPAIVAASGRGEDALFLDQMHPTVLGHRLLADAVESALNTENWPANALIPSSASPHEIYVDPFEGHGKDPSAPTHSARVTAPGANTDSDLILVVEDPNGAPLQSIRLPSGSGSTVSLDITVKDAIFRLVFDRDHNGQTPNDEVRSIGPIHVGVGEIPLVFAP